MPIITRSLTSDFRAQMAHPKRRRITALKARINYLDGWRKVGMCDQDSLTECAALIMQLIGVHMGLRARFSVISELYDDYDELVYYFTDSDKEYFARKYAGLAEALDWATDRYDARRREAAAKRARARLVAQRP